MLRGLRLYISPFFLSRYYIKKDIFELLKKYNFEGKFIDVGCGSKPYKELFREVREYSGIDFKSYSVNKDFQCERPDYFFRNNYLTNLRLQFKTNEFDNAGAFQVLEHVNNPSKLLKEMFRIVRPGGYILVSFPFIGGLHELPNDYQRLTIYGLRYVISKYKAKIIYVKKQGSIFSVIAILLNEYLNGFASKSKKNYFFSMIVYPIFFLFSNLCFILDYIFKSENIFLNYLVLIKNGK